jgi:predicted small secreted protein
MEFAAILSFLSEKTPEFIAGAAMGVMVSLFIAYVYLLPRLIKSSNAALTAQVKLLSDQVNVQTSHIKHLEEQVKGLQEELQPYKEFALKHFENAMAINAV